MKIPSSNIIKISDTHSVVIDREAEIKEGVFDKLYFNTYDNLLWKYRPSPCSLPYWGNIKTLREILFTIGVAIPGIPLLVEEDEAKTLEEFLNDNLQKSKDEKNWNDDKFSQGWISALIHVKVNYLELHAARSKGTFTQEQMRDCFEQSRLTHPMVGFKHDTFEDYIHSLSHPPIKEIIIEEDVTTVYDETSAHEYKWEVQPKYFDKEKNIITAKFIR